jgi:p-cumate 2,3-dioxygenase subunit alpha
MKGDSMKRIADDMWRVDPQRNLFQVARQTFVEPDILEAERSRIFDTCWLYIGHTSELKKPGDFSSRSVGGRRLLFNRDAQGKIHAFLNSCPHRGATVCRERTGNAKTFTCGYHGWVFGAEGKLRNIPGAEHYCDGFNDDGHADLMPVPRLESYRDFWFVCFDPGAVSLEQYLGAAGEYLDLVADHSEAGMEILSGMQEYQINANWKLLVENSIDGYHAPITHSTYIDYLRNANGPENIALGSGLGKDLGNGHSVIEYTSAWARPIARWLPQMGEAGKTEVEAIFAKLVQRHGQQRAERIANFNRNLLIFPNLIVLDIMAVSVRTFYPRAPGMMEVYGWAMGPAEESDWLRKFRLENFLEFIGPGGFATPDDIEMLEQCQAGYANLKEAGWNDISKGMPAGEMANHRDERQIRAFWVRWHEMLKSPAKAGIPIIPAPALRAAA